MAYASTVTKSYSKGLYVFKIAATDASGTSETTLTGVPPVGRVIRVVSELTSGSGATVDPVLGTATAPSGNTLIVENDTAAASTDNIEGEGVPFECVTANTLYFREVCDTGTDNVVTSWIYLKAGI